MTNKTYDFISLPLSVRELHVRERKVEHVCDRVAKSKLIHQTGLSEIAWNDQRTNRLLKNCCALTQRSSLESDPPALKPGDPAGDWMHQIMEVDVLLYIAKYIHKNKKRFKLFLKILKPGIEQIVHG